MKQIFFAFIVFFSHFSLGQVPHLQGTMYLDIPHGLITCHFSLSNIPSNGEYSILLNKQFNVKWFRQKEQFIYFDKKDNGDEAFQYNLYNEGDTLPKSSVEGIIIDYTGAFPTYKNGEVNKYGDDMGVIAIKNNILRATSQSVFIPELFDRKTKRTIIGFTYDFVITCSKVENIYINSLAPQTGKILYFKTTNPVEFLIYAGQYKIKHQGNLYLLNTNLADKCVIVLSKKIQQISNYYAKIMNKPYDANVTLGQIFSIGPENQYPNWGFTVTPTIVMDLDLLGSRVDTNTQNLSKGDFEIIAHEMAHKYNAKIRVTNNLWRFYNESVAQYLALKSVEELMSKQDYQSCLKKSSFVNHYQKGSFPTFNEMETTNQDITSAAYDYYSLYLVGFEKLFGKSKTLLLLQQFIKNKDQFTPDSNYFKLCAMDAGITESDWNDFDNKFLKTNNFLNQFGN
jgi:hypothetical protein